MKISIISLNKIALIGLIGFILITCQKEDPTIINDNIETVKHAVEPTSINDTGYLLDLITTIESMVNDGVLNAGNGNALISKINNAINSIEKGNTNAVSGQLGSFINSTEALANSGTLTDELAESLITVAETGIILTDGSIVDPRDGEEYFVVLIGEQLWMAENLKATQLTDGTDIPLVTDNSFWIGLSTPAYCWYENDETTYGDTYGALYNWYTVETGNFCPTGWHVPSDGEWTVLTDYLAGASVAGGKLKESGTAHWNSPNEGATNESGFTALPGGSRYTNGSFNDIGLYGTWWSATGYITSAQSFYMAYHLTSVTRYGGQKHVGFSVRCVRD